MSITNKIDVNLSVDDWESVIPEKKRSQYSAKEFWFKKRTYILKRIHGIDFKYIGERELLLAILEMNTKIYWELRKLNELKGS